MNAKDNGKSKLKTVVEVYNAGDDEEPSDSSSSESSSSESESSDNESDGSTSAKSRRKKKKKKLKKKKKAKSSKDKESREERNRKGVPRMEKINATVKLLVKLNEKADNWRDWLNGIKGTAKNEGWNPNIMDPNAKLWDEDDYESVSEIKLRKAAYIIITNTIHPKLLQAVESVREGGNNLVTLKCYSEKFVSCIHLQPNWGNTRLCTVNCWIHRW